MSTITDDIQEDLQELRRLNARLVDKARRLEREAANAQLENLRLRKAVEECRRDFAHLAKGHYLNLQIVDFDLGNVLGQPTSTAFLDAYVAQMIAKTGGEK